VLSCKFWEDCRAIIAAFSDKDSPNKGLETESEDRDDCENREYRRAEGESDTEVRSGCDPFLVGVSALTVSDGLGPPCEIGDVFELLLL
jgi:hypothetical protein